MTPGCFQEIVGSPARRDVREEEALSFKSHTIE
jgi:hypothetical protein